MPKGRSVRRPSSNSPPYAYLASGARLIAERHRHTPGPVLVHRRQKRLTRPLQWEGMREQRTERRPPVRDHGRRLVEGMSPRPDMRLAVRTPVAEAPPDRQLLEPERRPVE